MILVALLVSGIPLGVSLATFAITSVGSLFVIPTMNG